MAPFHKNSRFTIENNVLKGDEVSYHDDYDSLGEFVLASMEINLDFVGQIDAVTGEEYTYRKMRERSVRCALWMRSQGLRQRDVIAICSDNHLDFAMPCFAALYLGAAFTLWDVTGKAEDFRHRMNITKPKMIFVSKGSATVVAEAAKKEKLDLKIIVFGRGLGFSDFDSVIAEPRIDEVNKYVNAPIKSSDEIASILFSSGTTGLPKGVSLSHRAIFTLSRQSEELNMPGNVVLHFTATHWNAVIDSMFMTLLLKIPRIILPPFDVNSACTLIEKYKASWVLMTPFMVDQLVKSDALSTYDLSSLARIHLSGAPLYIASYRALKRLFPNLHIISCYGMTESCGYMSMQSTNSPPGSCGCVMENAQVKVIDPDSGRTLGANEKGELLLKFTAMMSYYHNDPVATAQLIDDDGWIHSGDFGYYDETGEIFVIDRLKDIIRCVECDISPSEIESVILSHPGVKEVAVVGQPRPQDADLPIAFVVRTKDSCDTMKQVTETDIVNLVAAELRDSKKQLRAGVRFLDQIPKTPTNKVRRMALRELAKSMIQI